MHGRSPPFPQHGGGGPQGRTRGVDVVDQQDGGLESEPTADPGELRSDQPALELGEWCEALAARRIVLPVAGPHGVVLRTVRVWEHCFEVFKGLRERLVLTPSA